MDFSAGYYYQPRTEVHVRNGFINSVLCMCVSTCVIYDIIRSAIDSIVSNNVLPHDTAMVAVIAMHRMLHCTTPTSTGLDFEYAIGTRNSTAISVPLIEHGISISWNMLYFLSNKIKSANAKLSEPFRGCHCEIPIPQAGNLLDCHEIVSMLLTN